MVVVVTIDVKIASQRKFVRPKMSGPKRGGSARRLASPTGTADPSCMRWVALSLAVVAGCRSPSEDRGKREQAEKIAEKPTVADKVVEVDFSAEAGPSKPKVGATYTVEIEITRVDRTRQFARKVDGFDVQILGAKAGFVLVSAAPTSAKTEVFGSIFIGHFKHSISPGKKVGAVLTLAPKTAGNHDVTIELHARQSDVRLVDSDGKRWSLTAPVVVLP